jgi:hypothetical protein
MKNAGMNTRGAVKMKPTLGVAVVVDIAEVESGPGDHFTRCTDGGAGASDRTSLDGRVREVDDLKGDEPPRARQSYEFKPKEVDDSEEEQLEARRLRKVEQQEEVAGVGNFADFDRQGEGRCRAET